MKLQKFQTKAEKIINQFQALIDTMEQKGNSTTDCQKLMLQQALNELDYCVNGTNQLDLNTDEENENQALKLYRKRKTFNNEDHKLIDTLIEDEVIDNDITISDFIDYCVNKKNWNGDNWDLLMDFQEHYSNGLTHVENYRELLSFIKQN